MLTVECVPFKLARIMTQELSIPVTGVGAGPYVDGSTINMYDLLGLFDKFTPKHVKKYANLSADIMAALEIYKREVLDGTFPKEENSFTISDEELQVALQGGVTVGRSSRGE